MDTDIRGEQMIQGLSFEVEAIPQEDTIYVRSPANVTPITVKIRVRKREDEGMQKGIISVPKFGPIDSGHEKIRLVSSDQTIMSFNMLMEADLERKPLQKPRKRFFGGCLGTQKDDDDVPYVPATIGTRDSKSETGIVNTKLMLAANTGDDYDTYVMARKDKKFFGKCKPGGCLDPPFNEEKYSYQPTSLQQTLRTQNDNIVVVERPDDKRVETQSPLLSKGLLRKKRKSSDTSSIKTSDKEDPDDKSILSLYKADTTETRLGGNESDHIITYPPELTYSEQRINDERRKHSRSSSASKSRKSYNEISSLYYIPPKKDSTNSNVREESIRNSNDKNISLLRKGVATGKVLAEDESTGQDGTASNEIKGKMAIATVAAASAIPYILRHTDNTKSLKISTNLDDIKSKQENIEANTSFEKNNIIKPEWIDNLMNDEKLKNGVHEKVALRGLPQLGSDLGKMADDYTSDTSVVDKSKDDLINDEKLNEDGIKREREALKGRPQLLADLGNMADDYTGDTSVVDEIAPANNVDDIENMEKLEKDKNLDSLPTLNAMKASGPNSEKYSKGIEQDKAAKDALLDGKDDGKEPKAKKHSLLSDTSDMKINSKQSKKEGEREVASSANNTLRTAGRNYRKHSSLVGTDKYTMDTEPGDRDIRDKEELLQPTKISSITNTSDSYSAINALTSSGPYYRKHSSSQEQDKSNQLGDKDRKEEIKPKKLSVTANTYDSKVDLKQPKQENEKEGRFSITSTYGSSGPFYTSRKHSGLVGQDKTPKQRKSEDRDERKNSALVRNVSDSNALGSSDLYHTSRKQSSLVEHDTFSKNFKSGNKESIEIKPKQVLLPEDTSDSKLYVEQLKDADQNTGSQKIIKPLKSSTLYDRKHSEDKESNKIQHDYDGISFPTNAELAQKPLCDILSDAALRKVQHYSDINQSEIRDEATFVAKIHLENGQHRNENIMPGEHVIDDMKNKKDLTQHSETVNFSRQTEENVTGETSMDIDDLDKKAEAKGHESAKNFYKDNADIKETVAANYRIENGKISTGKQPESLTDTLQGVLVTQDGLQEDHKDISKQINYLKTTGAASGGDDIDRNILQNLLIKVNENEIVDSLSSKDNGVDKTVSKEKLQTNYLDKKEIKGDKREQQITDEAGKILHEKISFTSKDGIQDMYSGKPKSMKESGSNASINYFNIIPKITSISTPSTIHETSEDSSHTDAKINEIKTAPIKVKVANYFDKIIQGQQNERTSHQDGIITKPTISVVRDSITLDLAFTSFLNDKEEKVVKTLETSVDAKTMDNVVVVKTTVKSDGKDIRIPIDYNNYMSIKIKKAYKDGDHYKLEATSLDHVTGQGESTEVHIRTHSSDGKFESTESNNQGNVNEPWASKGSDNNNILQETLTSIYERELVPLQNIIKCLKDDIDVLAEQQIKFRDTVNGVKVLRPTRLIHSDKRCGCIRK